MDQLQDLLAQLVGKLRPEDLVDPEMASLLSQLIATLDPKSEPIPQELAQELLSIPDKIERFRIAAQKLGSNDPAHLRQLALRMKENGLFKSD